jgi:hypothetical protein
MFGKLFSKIEKPYYTIVGDYVIFCDDIKTLLNSLDDLDEGKTLDKTEDFNRFHAGFKKENSLLIYLNMKKYFLNLKGLLNPESYQASYNNRQFVICFEQMGFQFTAEENRFDTRLLIQFHNPSLEDMLIAEGKALDQEGFEALDSLSDADAFILKYISGSVKREFYTSGKLKILAEMDGSTLNGRYIEYYENGNEKAKGKYKQGFKNGKWIFYKENGDLDYKEKYKRGVNQMADTLAGID